MIVISAFVSKCLCLCSTRAKCKVKYTVPKVGVQVAATGTPKILRLLMQFRLLADITKKHRRENNVSVATTLGNSNQRRSIIRTDQSEQPPD